MLNEKYCTMLTYEAQLIIFYAVYNQALMISQVCIAKHTQNLANTCYSITDFKIK